MSTDVTRLSHLSLRARVMPRAVPSISQAIRGARASSRHFRGLVDPCSDLVAKVLAGVLGRGLRH